jgi:hypothetical protein
MWTGEEVDAESVEQGLSSPDGGAIPGGRNPGWRRDHRPQQRRHRAGRARERLHPRRSRSAPAARPERLPHPHRRPRPRHAPGWPGARHPRAVDAGERHVGHRERGWRRCGRNGACPPVARHAVLAVRTRSPHLPAVCRRLRLPLHVGRRHERPNPPARHLVAPCGRHCRPRPARMTWWSGDDAPDAPAVGERRSPAGASRGAPRLIRQEYGHGGPPHPGGLRPHCRRPTDTRAPRPESASGAGWSEPPRGVRSAPDTDRWPRRTWGPTRPAPSKTQPGGRTLAQCCWRAVDPSSPRDRPDVAGSSRRSATRSSSRPACCPRTCCETRVENGAGGRRRLEGEPRRPGPQRSGRRKHRTAASHEAVGDPPWDGENVGTCR